jgi:hypothetical protein
MSAPAGNPSYPSVIEEGFFIPDTKIINFRTGYQTYNSEDLVMKFDDLSKEEGYYLRKVKAFCNSAIITLNIKERLDLYGEIGSFRLEPEFRYLANLYNCKSENDLLYRGGTRLILFEILDFTLATDVKYSIFNGSASYLTENDRPINEKIKFNFKEWQIAVGLAQKITILRPYIGIAYRDTRIKMENTPFFHTLDFIYKKKAGLFLGTSASLGSFVFLNGEIRLVNERSTIISGEFRF